MSCRIYLLISCLLLIFSSCSNTRYLAEHERLYTGAKIEIEAEEEVHRPRQLKKELENLTRPRPNTTVFGVLRPKLWLYNIAGEPTGRGIRHWLRNKVGEEPVLFEEVSPQQVADRLESRLQNRGYFQAETDYEVQEKNQRVKVKYIAKLHSPYRVLHVIFPAEDRVLEQHIRNAKDNSLLQPGDPYNLETLVQERERIDEYLKNQGYFYFNPDFLLFRVDSTAGSRQVNIHLSVKPEIPAVARQVFNIREVFVITDYTLENDTVDRSDDMFLIDGYYYIPVHYNFKPRAVLNGVMIEPGSIYRRDDHFRTISRLMDLGIFTFVNINFERIDTATEGGWLDAWVYLTQNRPHSVRVEARAISKTSDFHTAGPGFSLNYRNRNLFKGAEMFNTRFNSSYEFELGREWINSYEFGVENELFFPRIISPVKIEARQGRYMPRTKISLGFQRLSRVRFYNLNSFNASFGYLWRSSPLIEHELNALNVNMVNIYRTTEEFHERVDANPLILRSFNEQFIAGSTYKFTYNELAADLFRRNQFYYSGNIDFSGNLLYTLFSLFSGREGNPDDPYLVFNEPFSQYSRIENDFRHYHNLSERTMIASRFIAGLGVPYGNSITLPFIRQFSIGGVNSIRAFQPRTLGPGSFPVEIEDRYWDRTGEMKLEMNTELRFPIAGVVHGAVFGDAGNIWLLRENPALEGGEFHFNTFLHEVAVGTGAGIRVDVSFFVLRVDLGFPLRVPAEDWFQRPLALNQLNLNISLGYPY